LIQKYVYDIAAQMKIQLSQVSVIEGRNVGCLDVHLLNVTSNGHLVSVLVYQSELDKLQIGDRCERLESRIRSALSGLQVLPES
jgi:translation initiation factor 6 (eIF-6)